MTISVAQRARLGVFVIAGTVLLVAFVSVSLGLKYSQTTKTYVASFQGESLSGLEEGALVVERVGRPVQDAHHQGARRHVIGPHTQPQLHRGQSARSGTGRSTPKRPEIRTGRR